MNLKLQKEDLRGLVLPADLNNHLFSSGLMKEKDFKESLSLVKKQVMYIEQIFGHDAHGNQINVGDIIGKIHQDNIYTYIVCAESDRVFYLTSYIMLRRILSGDITNCEDLYKKAPITKLLKQNSNKSIIIQNMNTIPEMVRDKYIRLQEKIIEIHGNKDI